MRNADTNNSEYVHLYIALRRKKDNPDLKPLCFREIVYNESSLDQLKIRLKDVGGIWRIHKTINKRSTHKALNLLHHKIIDDPLRTAERLLSEWKTCLMLRGSKAERNILLDIDSNEAYDNVLKICQENSLELVDYSKSPSGHHIVINAENVDTRLFSDIKDVTFQRDGYKFIEVIKGEI